MIKVLDSGYVELGDLNRTLSSFVTEKLNSEYELQLESVLTADNTNLLNGNNILEAAEDWFDIVYYQKSQSEEGDLSAVVEAEHVSYQLNDPEYDLEYFTEIGTPDTILDKILLGTGFTRGTMEFIDSVTYSLQEKCSRRLVLIDFVNYLGGEIIFEKFQVSVVQRRGSATPIDLMSGGNIEIIDKIFNKRERNENGEPLLAYTCELIQPTDIQLGDAVTLQYETLDIDVDLRVVSVTKDPNNSYTSYFEIGNFVPGIEDEARRIETSVVGKGRKYYGARISPENGFESIRNDELARTVFNADVIAMQTKDGEGNWVNRLWFNTETGTYEFDGELSANVITAMKAQIDVVVSNVTITQTLAAEKGDIAELTVDRIDTSDKVQKFLNSDTNDDNYIVGHGKEINLVTATTDGQSTEQQTDRNGNLLFWQSLEHKGITYEDTGLPVTIYQYEELVKMAIRLFYDATDQLYKPQIVLGAGSDNELHPDWGKVFLQKDSNNLDIKYISEIDGTETILRVGEGEVKVKGADGFESIRIIAIGNTAPTDPENNSLWIDTGGI